MEHTNPITQSLIPLATENAVNLFAYKMQFSRVEAAQLLGFSVRTLDRLIAEKQIAVRRIGKRVFILKDTLLLFVKRDHPTGSIQ